MICIYDLKTGRAGIGWLRALELAKTANYNFPGMTRFLIIELRPWE